MMVNVSYLKIDIAVKIGGYCSAKMTVSLLNIGDKDELANVFNHYTATLSPRNYVYIALHCFPN